MKMGLVIRLLSTEGLLASCITLINHKSFLSKNENSRWRQQWSFSSRGFWHFDINRKISRKLSEMISVVISKNLSLINWIISIKFPILYTMMRLTHMLIRTSISSELFTLTIWCLSLHFQLVSKYPLKPWPDNITGLKAPLAGHRHPALRCGS